MTAQSLGDRDVALLGLVTGQVANCIAAPSVDDGFNEEFFSE